MNITVVCLKSGKVLVGGYGEMSAPQTRSILSIRGVDWVVRKVKYNITATHANIKDDGTIEYGRCEGATLMVSKLGNGEDI